MSKRGRVRSVGIPPWVKVALDRWAQAAGPRDGRIFLALNKDGSLAGAVRTKGGTRTDGFLTPQAIYNVVKKLCWQQAIIIGKEKRTLLPRPPADGGSAGAERRRRSVAAPANVGPRQHHDDRTLPGTHAQPAGDGWGFHPD